VKEDDKCKNTSLQENRTDEGAESIDLGKRSRDYSPPECRGTMDTFLPEGARRGREYILVDEWGPYDFRKPKVWPASITAGNEGRFFIYGEGGKFEIRNVPDGLSVSPLKGTIPATVVVKAARPGLHRFHLGVETGGERLAASGTLLSTEWEVKFYQWDREKDPRTDPQSWKELIRTEPKEARVLDAIAFNWGGAAPGGTLRADHFGTVAETNLVLPAGTFEITTLSDDGIRVWIDGKLVIDNWTWHPPTEDRAVVTLKKGAHPVRIEHFEIDGWAALSFSLRQVGEK